MDGICHSYFIKLGIISVTDYEIKVLLRLHQESTPCKIKGWFMDKYACSEVIKLIIKTLGPYK